MNKSQILKTKVCGITEQENMLSVAEAGADYLGFIFHPDSPRDVGSKIKELDFSVLPNTIKTIAVMVDKPLKEAMAISQNYRFDYVQLHGSETPQYCSDMQGVTGVIKAFGIYESLPDNLNEYMDCCDFFLFDTRGEKVGGNGLSFDHEILRSFHYRKPYFLGGGISPLHVDIVPSMDLTGFYAFDLNSKFEIRPGLKDPDLIKTFIHKLQKL
ncbi:MAG: phosphoribosylanthranilate isomerase [Bacteroidota bacterium]